MSQTEERDAWKQYFQEIMDSMCDDSEPRLIGVEISEYYSDGSTEHEGYYEDIDDAIKALLDIRLKLKKEIIE